MVQIWNFCRCRRWHLDMQSRQLKYMKQEFTYPRLHIYVSVHSSYHHQMEWILPSWDFTEGNKMIPSWKSVIYITCHLYCLRPVWVSIIIPYLCVSKITASDKRNPAESNFCCRCIQCKQVSYWGNPFVTMCNHCMLCHMLKNALFITVTSCKNKILLLI